MKYNYSKTRLIQAVIICLLFYSYAFRILPVGGIKLSDKQQAAINDSTLIKKNIISFLQWYKVNLHKANSFPLLIKDSKGYYVINKKACSDYLSYLKSSKLLSDKYIGYWKTYLDDKATVLKKDKLKSDMPEGFDFDFVLITQEPDLILNKIDSLKFSMETIKNNEAVMGLTLPSDKSVDYKFEMKKTLPGWQIEYISTSNYD